MPCRLRALAALILLCSAVAAAGEPPVVLADFEDGMRPFEDKAPLRVVAEHATTGGHALLIEPGASAVAWAWNGLAKDWSVRDVVRFDAFAAGDEHVQLGIQIRDAMNEPNYWAWHNRYTSVAPGANTVQFSIADIYRGEGLRRDVPGFLDPKDIRQLVITNQGKAAIFVDNLRLEANAVAKVEVPGLRAFDVGPAGSPGFPGFADLTEKDAYTAERGYGWKAGTRFGNTSPGVAVRLHPDNLFRDWLALTDGTLQVDLPDGKYRVMLQLEDPGAWEYMQNYRHRTVTAGGKTVIDESVSYADFMAKYFRNQDAEDAPGEDPFEKYVETRHPWHVVDVAVAGGHLELGFRSDDAYGATLSAVIIAPAEHAADLDRFVAYVKEMRRADWAQAWKAAAKPVAERTFAGPAAVEAKRDGYALRAVSAYATGDYQGVYADDPLAAADPTLKALGVTAARGETEPATFALIPARPVGTVTVAVSPLAGPGGAVLPASAVQVRVGRYRFSRHDGEQSGLYSVHERELRLFNRTPADALRCDDGLARRFWIIAALPADAAPGTYRGTVTVAAEKGGGKREIPLAIEVLPFALPEPKHAFALYGVMLVPTVYYPEQEVSYLKDVDRMLGDLAAHGINYVADAVVAPRCAWKDGKGVVANADEVEAYLALRRKHGFLDLPMGMPTAGSIDELAGSATVDGKPKRDFIQGWYGTLVDTAKARGWPHPYFVFGDEPTTDEICQRLAAVHGALHAVSPDIWTCIAYDIHGPASEALVPTIDVHHLKAFCPVADFAKAKPSAKLLLQSNTGFGRAAYGLREWRAMRERGVDGAITYSYTGSHVDIYYDLDARESDYSCSPPRLDGSRDLTSYYELTREGVDDFRYARAVEALAADAKAPGAAKAAAADLLKQAETIGGEKDDAALPHAIAWRIAAQKLLASQAR